MDIAALGNDQGTTFESRLTYLRRCGTPHDMPIKVDAVIDASRVTKQEIFLPCNVLTLHQDLIDLQQDSADDDLYGQGYLRPRLVKSRFLDM